MSARKAVLTNGEPEWVFVDEATGHNRPAVNGEMTRHKT